MKLYNSATRKIEELIPNHPDILKMYTCGPTVYHFAHIGNLRSYIMEDVLEKYLRFSGYNVKRVMNITDVGHLTSDADEGEDKMLKGAKREHKSVMEIAKFYTDAFFSDCAKLNIKTPDVVEPATNCIDDYIRIISKLMDTGYAYFAGGNVYFDTSKLERYYIFNDFSEEDLAVGQDTGVAPQFAAVGRSVPVGASGAEETHVYAGTGRDVLDRAAAPRAEASGRRALRRTPLRGYLGVSPAQRIGSSGSHGCNGGDTEELSSFHGMNGFGFYKYTYIWGSYIYPPP